MALLLTRNNVLLGQDPDINDSEIDEVALNISDPDHSLNYTSGALSSIFEISYGAQSDISYVAVSGHTLTSGSISLYDGTTLVDTVALTRSNNVMFSFAEMDFTDLIVKFEQTVPEAITTVSFIAAGQVLSLETGEQVGYKRNWLNRHLTQRTTRNSSSAPVSSLTQNKPLKGSLSLPNEGVLFSQTDWQDFIDFAFEQPFFIKEVEDNPASSYICFNPEFDTSSHGQTLNLNVLKLNFTVFNGL